MSDLALGYRWALDDLMARPWDSVLAWHAELARAYE
jgi:hypothetical protein